MTVLRYLGIAKEAEYGTKLDPKFFVDTASAGLDVPDGPELIKPGGLQRFKRDHSPGMYVPSGPLEFVADPPLLWYILWLLLGTKATTDNTSTISDEATPSDASGIISATLANTPVVPGTIIIEDSGSVQEAHDDGFGNIVQDAASGIAGTIDYATGVLYATGAQTSEAYTTTYDEGTFEHVITSSNDNEMLSATLKLGKDYFMHTFVGCAFQQMVLSVEREYAMVSLDVIGQQDEKETILSLANITIPQGYPLPFHKMTAKMVDYGGTLSDVSAIVESLTLTINNNADGEGAVTLGSRFPRRIWSGEMELTAEMTLVFENTNELEDFWGGALAPSADGVTEKAVQLYLNGGALGTVTFDLFRCIPTNWKVSTSGRERSTQEFSLEALWDTSQNAIIKATCSSVYNYA